jgi:hypothetical protein
MAVAEPDSSFRILRFDRSLGVIAGEALVAQAISGFYLVPGYSLCVGKLR